MGCLALVRAQALAQAKPCTLVQSLMKLVLAIFEVFRQLDLLAGYSGENYVRGAV